MKELGMLFLFLAFVVALFSTEITTDLRKPDSQIKSTLGLQQNK
jgi:hypothetical protein